MACAGCAERGRLIAAGAQAVQAGAWAEAARAAQGVAASVRLDLGRLAERAAQAAAAVRRGG